VSPLSAADAFGSPLKLSLKCCNQPQEPDPDLLLLLTSAMCSSVARLSYLICATNRQTIWHKLQGNAIKEDCAAPPAGEFA